MKKILFFLLVVLLGAPKLLAGSRYDSHGETVYQSLFGFAEYQMLDFDNAEYSSTYGVGFAVSSFSHWGRFHVGAKLDIQLNYGVVDSGTIIPSVGPSVRVDICKNVFVNIPVMVSYGEGDTNKDKWGGSVAPTIHAFFNEKIGLFAGPAMFFSFNGADPTFGIQAGIAFAL